MSYMVIFFFWPDYRVILASIVFKGNFMPSYEYYTTIFCRSKIKRAGFWRSIIVQNLKRHRLGCVKWVLDTRKAQLCFCVQKAVYDAVLKQHALLTFFYQIRVFSPTAIFHNIVWQTESWKAKGVWENTAAKNGTDISSVFLIIHEC